jgi:hypothetical protein
MPASILASGGLILRFMPSLQNLERALLAGGILLMFVSQTLRLLERNPKIGPLVLMAQKMIPDTLRFLSLIIGPVVGIAFSMVVLFKGQFGLFFEFFACGQAGHFCVEFSELAPSGCFTKVVTQEGDWHFWEMPSSN